MNYYLHNYSFGDQLLSQKPVANLGIVVVIPCCNEPDLTASLQSLYECTPPTCGVEIIVVINASEKAADTTLTQNAKSFAEATSWEKSHSDKFGFHFIEENKLPKKHAGVGLARKIGMDEAVRRLEKVNNHQGIIACFDADSQCETNYLTALETHFKQHLKSPACSIHFEHPITGDAFPKSIYKGIIQYELHLRYYKNGLAYANLPYAFHTVGSSMAVRSEAYQKQNGMNKKKAGEDFYFLQKLIPLGDFTTLKTTKVIPSPRVSDRVPFGTGKAIQSWLEEEKDVLMSYHPQSFVDLKNFVLVVPHFFEGKSNIPASIQAFLTTIDFEKNLTNIRKNSTSEAHFIANFFKWFNAFKVLKYMHFARLNHYPDIAIFEGANGLLELMKLKKEPSNTALLFVFRWLDLR